MKKKTRSLQRDNLFLDGTKPDFFEKTVVQVYPPTLRIK